MIDDDAGKTLAAVSTLQKDLAGKKRRRIAESAERVGKAIAEKLLAKKGGKRGVRSRRLHFPWQSESAGAMPRAKAD